MEPAFIGALIGGVTAIVILFAMGLGASTRDRVIFRSGADIHGTIRRWADHHGYRVIGEGQTLQLQKGKGLATAAVRVEIERRGDEYKLESWTPIGVGKKRDMALKDSGWMAKVPRKKAAGEIDALLASLGQPPLPAR